MSDLNNAQMQAVLEQFDAMVTMMESGAPINDVLAAWAAWRALCDHINADAGLLWWCLAAHDESPVRDPAQH